MTEFLMTTWDGAGTTPPLMSVANALVQRGHSVRVLADDLLRPEVRRSGPVVRRRRARGDRAPPAGGRAQRAAALRTARRRRGRAGSCRGAQPDDQRHPGARCPTVRSGLSARHDTRGAGARPRGRRAHARGWDEALPALNDARAEHGLPPLEHVLDQGRSAARVLVLTSRAFDFLGPLPPVVKHVGPRLYDPPWAHTYRSCSPHPTPRCCARRR